MANLDLNVKVAVDGQGNLTSLGQGIDGAEKSFSRMGAVGQGVLQGVGQQVTALGVSLVSSGISAAIDAVGNSISLASDKAEAASKVQVLFGDSANVITAASKNAATAVGLSSGAYLTAAGDLGNLLVNFGIAQDEAAGFSTEMITLAADLGSFNNASTQEVTEAMGAAFRGETEPIRRFGVMLDAASIAAKAVEMGLAAEGEALSAAAKTQASYALILEQTTAAQGDFARTSDGLANSQKIAAAQQAEAFTRIGEAIMPLATAIVPLLARGVVALVDGIMGIVAAVQAWFRDNQALVATLRQIAGDVIGALVQGVRNVITIVGNVITAIAAWIRDNQGLINTVRMVAATVIGALVSAVQTAIAIVLSIAQAIGRWMQDNAALIATITRVAGVILGLLGEAFGWIIRTMGQIGAAIGKWMTDNAGLINSIGQVIGIIVGGLSAAFGAIMGVIGTVIEIVRQVAEVFAVVFTGVGRVVVAVAGIVGGAIGTMVRFFTGLWDTIASTAAAIGRVLAVLFKPLQDSFNTVLGFIRGAWNTFAGFWNSIGIDIPRIEIPNPFGGSFVMGGGRFELPQLPHLAKGGIVTSPTLAMIGEAGPEAVVPLGRRGMGGVTINVTAGVGDPVAIGRVIVEAVKQYERANGPAW